MADYLVREEDGTSHLILEETGGDLLTEESAGASTIERAVAIGGVGAVTVASSSAILERAVAINATALINAAPEVPLTGDITPLGSLGSVNKKATDRTTSLVLADTVEVGKVVVVWYVNDSVFNNAIPTNGEQYFRCRDTQGNIYVNIGNETDHSGAFSQSGALAGIYITEVAHELTAGDEIIVEGASPWFPGETWARAISAEYFDFGGRRWAAASEARTVTRATAADPVPISFDVQNHGLEWLYLYGLGVEGPDSDTYTLDPDYTAIVGDGTTGGADTSNVHIRGGYRIATMSSDTVSITPLAATDRDNVQILTAVTGVPHRDNFPQSPIIDDFNRANEYPLDGGIWNAVGGKALGGDWAQIVGNVAIGTGGSQTLEEYEDCVEVYATAADFDSFILHYHAGGDTSGSTFSGFAVGWFVQGTTQRNFDTIDFGDAGFNGGVNLSRGTAWVDGGDGYKLGVARNANIADSVSGVHHIWIERGSGWEWVAAWVCNFSNNDGTLALGIGSIADIDDFGGGEIPCFRRFVPQIFRRTFGAR